MADDWHKRYDAAMEEMCAAKVEWEVADRAMARANYRRDRAERAFHRVFQERMDTIAASSSVTSNDGGTPGRALGTQPDGQQ